MTPSGFVDDRRQRHVLDLDHDTENDEHHRVTSLMFNDSPAFDREGDYLYYDGRTFRPEYSPVDGTFIYTEPATSTPFRLNDMDSFGRSSSTKWNGKK